MFKVPIVFIFAILLSQYASAENDESQAKAIDESSKEDYLSAERMRELDIDELIKSLEERLNANRPSNKDAYEVVNASEDHAEGSREDHPSDTCDKANIFQSQKSSFQVHPNLRDRKSLNSDGFRADQTQRQTQADLDVQARLDKRKISDSDNYAFDELKQEAYDLAQERLADMPENPLHRNQLSESETDEEYYRALLRLQNLYRAYNKEFLDEGGNGEERSSRHCGGPLGKKIHASKLRYLERSRLLADRIAESAMHLARKKDALAQHGLRPHCGCGKGGHAADSQLSSSSSSSSSSSVASSVRVAAEEMKRDAKVTASSATSSASAVNARTSAGGVEVDAGTSSSLDTASSVSTSLGKSSSSSSNVRTSSSLDTRLNVGAALPKSAALGNEWDATEDFERKMIMDMAIDEAAGMIRRLGVETRSEIAWQDESDYEKRILNLAIDLVNKVTEGVTGDLGGNIDVFEGYRYNNADEYLRATQNDVEIEPDLLSNVGFDYVNFGLARQLDGGRFYDGDLYDDYVGHPSPYSRGRCENCDRLDPRLGAPCPLCKRNDQPQFFQGRVKRKPSSKVDGRGKIYHLEQLEAQNQMRKKSGGVWEDVHKQYNFNDFENDKFIDLSMNCTENSTLPNCQRLYLDLVTPKDLDPVPLWFVRDYLSHGRDLAADMHDRARSLQTGDGLRPQPHSPSMLHFLNNRVSDSLVKLNEESQIVLFGTKVLQEKLLTEYNITPNTFLEFLRHHGFRVTGSQICRARQKRCNSLAKFRSIEGSCNNFRHPSWGQSNTAFARILPARYSDGIHALPVSVSGGPLPNPRTVSAQLFSRRNVTDSVFTLALMQWGQILAHDFARQVIDQTAEGGIECCDTRGTGPLSKSLQHHSCSPIVIPRTDGFYARYNQTCMNFVRSMTVTREDCSLGPANQLNGVSSFLDLSPVYGADQATSENLRTYRGGTMRFEIRSNRIMMPTSAKSGFCDARASTDICFETGDARTNQNPQLIVLQTLLIREHNRIAYELGVLNPHWNDERLFQESRHIVIAEYQHITYRHWLPLVIGKRYCREHNIGPADDRLSNDYDVKINPSTINSFTSAAFRFLHSMIEGNINLVADNYGASGTIRLSNYYFRPQIVEQSNNFESLLRGLVYQTMQKPDANFHEEVTEYLFRSDNDFGMDLEAIDIQRGRDHGIPGYNAYREICRLGRAHDFPDLINEISLNNIERLHDVYEHVEDIDLLVGAALETRLPGSLLGPTLQCLIGEQFYRTRVGDKYFYNNADFPHSFTPAQFEEIKKASLARLICDLGEAVYEVQRNPFKVSSYRNPTIPCYNLPRINLEYWKEEVFYQYS